MKLIFLFFAFLSLVIGVVGIVVPILPTTPFFLLTTFLFAKSSNTFHHWFISTKLYQNHLKNFVENRQMKKRDFWSLLVFVDLIMIMSFILIDNLFIRILIVLLEIGKYSYFLLRVKRD